MKTSETTQREKLEAFDVVEKHCLTCMLIERSSIRMILQFPPYARSFVEWHKRGYLSKRCTQRYGQALT